MEETHDADRDGEVRHETHGELHIEARSRGRERTLRRGRLAALREARPSGLIDAPDQRLVPVWLDGREALAVVGTASDTAPRYFIDLRWNDAGQAATILDVRYVRYIAIDASIDLATADQGHP